MNITLYSTPHCAFCLRIKNYLNSNKISFTEYDVANNREKAEEMVRISGQMGVPVLDIDGKIILGYNKPEIDKTLGL